MVLMIFKKKWSYNKSSILKGLIYWQPVWGGWGGGGLFNLVKMMVSFLRKN